MKAAGPHQGLAHRLRSRDANFLADTAKAEFKIRLVTGGAIQALVQEIYATPAPVVRRTVELLQ